MLAGLPAKQRSGQSAGRASCERGHALTPLPTGGCAGHSARSAGRVGGRTYVRVNTGLRAVEWQPERRRHTHQTW
jgi:hypothetical protein